MILSSVLFHFLFYIQVHPDYVEQNTFRKDKLFLDSPYAFCFLCEPAYIFVV